MADIISFEYLIKISKKYEIDAAKLFKCFLGARAHGKSFCKGISIECREKTEDYASFLLMQGQKVVSQLKLSEGFLRYLPEVDFSSFQLEETPIKKNGTLKAVDLQIKDLNARAKLVNLEAWVIEKSTSRMVFSRFGDALIISTAILSDNTGLVKLILWNNQIDMIAVGDAVRIENGKVKMFRGELQVDLGREGRLHVIKNQSMADYVKANLPAKGVQEAKSRCI
jgi:replication factor A1